VYANKPIAEVLAKEIDEPVEYAQLILDGGKQRVNQNNYYTYYIEEIEVPT